MKGFISMSHGISKKNRIVIFLMIISMSFLCAFSHSNELDTDWQSSSSCLHKADSSISTSTIKMIDGGRVLENNSGFRIKVAEEQARIRDSKRGGYAAWYIACIFAALMIHFTSMYVHFLVKSDLTPRYSIISYLHRSDGKKSALSIV